MAAVDSTRDAVTPVRVDAIELSASAHDAAADTKQPLEALALADAKQQPAILAAANDVCTCAADGQRTTDVRCRKCGQTRSNAFGERVEPQLHPTGEAKEAAVPTPHVVAAAAAPARAAAGAGAEVQLQRAVEAVQHAIGAAGARGRRPPEFVVLPALIEVTDTKCDIGTEPRRLSQVFPAAPEGVRRSLAALPAGAEYHYRKPGSAPGSHSAEPRACVDARILAALLWVVTRPERHIVLVGHSAFFKRMLKASAKLDNCGLVRCVLSHDMTLRVVPIGAAAASAAAGCCAAAPAGAIAPPRGQAAAGAGAGGGAGAAIPVAELPAVVRAGVALGPGERVVDVIRHGESTFNEWRKDYVRCQCWWFRDPGFVDAELSAAGYAQVRKLHATLRANGVYDSAELVVVSPLRRALATALGGFGLPNNDPRAPAAGTAAPVQPSAQR